MAFRVYCPTCGKVAVVTSSNEMDPLLKDAYCVCKDPNCGHTFVVSVEFKHTISPSAHNLPEDLRQQLRKTAPAEQGSLFTGVSTGS